MTMVTVVVPNLPDSDHLNYVSEKMMTLGPPLIRAIWSGGMWFAAEGSHRIAAAHSMGILPVIVNITGEGAIVQREEIETAMTVDELKRWLVSDMHAPRYVFEELSFSGHR